MIHAIPEGVVLTVGCHIDPTRDGYCARELLHYMQTGTKMDRTPECLTVCCSALPILNDSCCWLSDQHRTDTFMPWLPLLMLCGRDEGHDRIRAYRLADLVVRVIKPERLDQLGFTDRAAKLRALEPIVDDATAEAAWDVEPGDIKIASDCRRSPTSTAVSAAYDARSSAQWDDHPGMAIERYTDLILAAITDPIEGVE